MNFALIDDHQMVREGFKALIEEEHPNWNVVLELGSAEELLSCSQATQVDYYIIDISLPDKNGLELAALIGQQYADAKRIMLSMYEEKSYIKTALELGVDAYLSKRDAANELIYAIQSVAAGRRFYSPAISDRLVNDGKPNPCLSLLTARELEVFKLLAQGLNAKQISQVINVMPKTAHVHRANVMTKLQLTSQIQATKLALAEGLLHIDEIG